MNYDLLELKEKLFADYRNTIELAKKLKIQCKEDRAALEKLQVEAAETEKNALYMRDLIDYMIKNDLDPVTAKLKFQKEDYNRDTNIYHHPVYTASSASSIGSSGGLSVGSIGSISLASAAGLASASSIVPNGGYTITLSDDGC